MFAINTWLEKNLLPLFTKMSSQRHLTALRRAFLLIIPLVLVGSIFTLLPGLPGLNNLLAPYADRLSIASNATIGLISIYLTFALTYILATSYRLDALSVSLVGVVSFVISTLEFANIEGVDYAPITWVGTWGMFGAIVISLYTVEVYNLFINRKWYIKPPPGIPEGVGKFIQAILPMFVIVLPLWFLNIFNVKVAALIGVAVRPLLSLSDTYWAFLVALYVEHLTQYIGVHSWAAIGPAYFPFVINNTIANAEAFAAGAPLPYISTFGTYLGPSGGGTGGLVMPAIYGLFSKSKTLKAIARAGIIPTLFNVAEPILYGYPIVLNPFYFIPMCILIPISRSLAWVVVAAGLVERTSLFVFAFLPSPIMWYLNNLDWRVFIWGILISYLLNGIIWFPFFKMHEAYLLKEEAAS